MKHEASIYNAYDLLINPEKYLTTMKEVGGRYVPCRALAWPLGRLKAAWMVFTGRADVLVWPGQER